jgi:hypothetical protein
VLVVVAAIGLGACGYDGPTEDDVLPVARLTYPGAVEVGREFTPEAHHTTIHGAKLDLQATVRMTLRLAAPVTDQELIEWYEVRLAADGWSPGTDHIGIVREIGFRPSGSFCHRYAIKPKGDTYELIYTFGFMADCS